MNISPSSHCSLRPQLSTVACAFAVLVPSIVLAQTRSVDTTPPSREVRVVEPARSLKRSDRDFFDKAAKASMSEVAISRVAAARTSNPEVRRFAQIMIEDHERASEELGALATTYGFSLPAKDPHPDRWEKRDAKNFDKEYMDKMVSDHEDVVKLFEKQAKDGHDVEAVAFARKHLPKMQEHLQHALDLKRALSDKRR
jgi:putative membrane protein